MVSRFLVFHMYALHQPIWPPYILYIMYYINVFHTMFLTLRHSCMFRLVYVWVTQIWHFDKCSTNVWIGDPLFMSTRLLNMDTICHLDNAQTFYSLTQKYWTCFSQMMNCLFNKNGLFIRKEFSCFFLCGEGNQI